MDCKARTDTFDYIVIGSGFGGSVAAMRLAEKGYRVLVLERGKRFEDEDFATHQLACEPSTCGRRRCAASACCRSARSKTCGCCTAAAWAAGHWATPTS